MHRCRAFLFALTGLFLVLLLFFEFAICIDSTLHRFVAHTNENLGYRIVVFTIVIFCVAYT